MTIFSRHFLLKKQKSVTSRPCPPQLLRTTIILIGVFLLAVFSHQNYSGTTSSIDTAGGSRYALTLKSDTSSINTVKNDDSKLSLSSPPTDTAILVDDSSLVFTSKSCAAYMTREPRSAADTTATTGIAGVVARKITTADPAASFVLHVYEKNDIVSNSILNHGTWEHDKVIMFYNLFIDYSEKHNIPLSDLTFIDIGANIGWFTFSLAALGVKVIAFEPMEDNVKLIRDSMCLEENLKAGITDRITLYSHGLGVRNETCFIFSHNINTGDGHVKCVEKEDDLNIPPDHSIKGRIPVRRLDDVIHHVDGKHQHIIVVKMDTEGFEANVLQGGEQLFLQRGISVIVTEFVPEWIRNKGNVAPETFMQKFHDAGYLSTSNFDVGYMGRNEMLDMSKFALGRDVTLHSSSFRNSQQQELE
mmetsp:Transcript_12889/g.24205  ORF Transcript_12889/g.24205 Transcript_12889/m.24205 type:complete len:417 (-) Transcript_12889:1367-2617(-)